MKDWLDYDSYAVWGLGRSGIAASNLLAGRGKDVLASDLRPLDDLSRERKRLAEGVRVRGGGNSFGDAEVVIVSPGLRPTSEPIREAVERGLPIVSEVELAACAAEAPFIGITGTDGKSTTTLMAEHLLKTLGFDAVAGGNLGNPLCEFVEDLDPHAIVVAEISAFQLWSCHDLSPRSVGFTNIAHDHLDYFESFDGYVHAKKKLMANHDETTVGAFNMADEAIAAWAKTFDGRVIAYGAEQGQVDEWEDAFWLRRHELWARLSGGVARRWVQDVRALRVFGEHNALNLMCAAALALPWSEDLASMGRFATSFKPLPHRLERCGKVGEVEFVDDSKATNPHAALAGMESIAGTLVPIVGGVDKKLDLKALVRGLSERAEAVVLIGEIAPRLEACLLEDGWTTSRICKAATMKEAVERAYEVAHRTDSTVCLSPACSSFDMFRSYAHRGEVFQAAVADLGGE